MSRRDEHLLCLAGLTVAGALSLGVVPPDVLEAHKPELGVRQIGSELIIDWEAEPEVFYFMEASPDLSTWMMAKLLKDNAESGSLSLGTVIGGERGFYRLSLEGDPDAARLRGDPDGDGIISLLEVEADWDAFETMTSEDTDLDGIPDYFEIFHFGHIGHDAGYVAVAGGLTLAEAFANATDPGSLDSDRDGFTDAYEIANHLDPNYNQSRDNRQLDTDSDGVTDWIESRRGLNPSVQDSDGDGKDDAEDAVGYSDFFTFDAVSEGTYAVIDRGQPGEHERIRAINDLGTLAMGNRVDGAIQLLSFTGERSTFSGTFIDLNNRDQLLRHTAGTGPNASKTYINETLWFEDNGTRSRRTALAINDDGEVYHERFDSLSHSQSDQLYIESRGLFVGDTLLDLGPVQSAVTTAINASYESVGSTATYTSALTDSLILSLSGSDSTVIGEKLYFMDFFTFSHNGDYGFSSYLVERGFSGIGGAFGVKFDGYYFSDGIYVEEDEGNLDGIARLEGQPGLWKLWSSPARAGQKMSLSTAANGHAPRDGGEDQAVSGGSKIALNGIGTNGSTLWVNGRNMTGDEILGPNSEWSEVQFRAISDSGNFIAATAKKDGVTRVITLFRMDIAGHLPGPNGQRISATDEDDPDNLVVIVNDNLDEDYRPEEGFLEGLLRPDYENDQIDLAKDQDYSKITLQFPAGISQGTLTLKSSCKNCSGEVVPSFFLNVFTEDGATELGTADFTLDLASPQGALADIATNGEVTLLVEGSTPSGVEDVHLIWKYETGSVSVKDEVHFQLIDIDFADTADAGALDDDDENPATPHRWAMMVPLSAGDDSSGSGKVQISVSPSSLASKVELDWASGANAPSTFGAHTLSSATETLTIDGSSRALGNALEVKWEPNSQVIDGLNVDFMPRRPKDAAQKVKVALWEITARGGSTPSQPYNQQAILDFLEDSWTDGANGHFEIIQNWTSETVDYDLDSSGSLSEQGGHAEYLEIFSAFENSNADMDIYLVENMPNQTAARISNDKYIFIAENSKSGGSSPLSALAQEVGHVLGVPDGTSTDDGDDDEDSGNVMSDPQTTGSTQIRKVDWRNVNPQ